MTDLAPHVTHNNLDSFFVFLNRHFCWVDIESIGYDTSIYKEHDLVGIYSKDNPLSLSKTEALIRFVYNGGTLAILGDCCGLDNALNELLSDSLWNTGLFINTDGIIDSTNYYGTPEFAVIKDFMYHPIVSGIDSILIMRGGSMNITPPARRLAWGDDDAFSLEYDPWPPGTTIVVPHEPVVLALSHFGEGIILATSDMSIWHGYAWLGGGYAQFDNKQLAYNFFNCNTIPHFHYEPSKFSAIPCQPETVFIGIVIENYRAIEADSVAIKWEDSLLVPGGDLLSVMDSTLFLIIPTISYSLGDTIHLCIESIYDTGGYWPFDSICWWYYLDPLIDSLGPYIERLTTDTLYPGDTLLVYVNDTSGVDTTSLLVLMNLDTVETFSFEAGTLYIWGFPDSTTSVSVIVIAKDLYPCWENIGSAAFTVNLHTGIAEEYAKPESFELTVYPNPFNSALTICAPQVSEVEIFDINGRLVAQGLPMANRYIWTPDESLGSGIYLIKATYKNKSYYKKAVHFK